MANSINTSSITSLIGAFRQLQAKDSVTPESLGSLLQSITDAINALGEYVDRLNIQELTSGLQNASDQLQNINNRLEEALQQLQENKTGDVLLRAEVSHINSNGVAPLQRQVNQLQLAVLQLADRADVIVELTPDSQGSHAVSYAGNYFGAEADYDATRHGDGIYWCTDTGNIIFLGTFNNSSASPMAILSTESGETITTQDNRTILIHL